MPQIGHESPVTFVVAGRLYWQLLQIRLKALPRSSWASVEHRQPRFDAILSATHSWRYPLAKTFRYAGDNQLRCPVLDLFADLHRGVLSIGSIPISLNIPPREQAKGRNTEGVGARQPGDIDTLLPAGPHSRQFPVRTSSYAMPVSLLPAFRILPQAVPFSDGSSPAYGDLRNLVVV